VQIRKNARFDWATSMNGFEQILMHADALRIGVFLAEAPIVGRCVKGP
jgi:hypothetical protein